VCSPLHLPFAFIILVVVVLVVVLVLVGFWRRKKRKRRSKNIPEVGRAIARFLPPTLIIRVSVKLVPFEAADQSLIRGQLV
jgi:O-antigen/teichoic acid export membrane protein